jgi:hypothetical protein
MKRLEIKNWDTSDKILKWDYHNGLRIVMPDIQHQQPEGFRYRFVDDSNELKLTINIGRFPNPQKQYPIRGKSVGGNYSGVYGLNIDRLKDIGYVRYVFNEIIHELC